MRGPGVHAAACGNRPRSAIREQGWAGRAAPCLRRARADCLSESPIGEDAQYEPSGDSRREVFLIFIPELPIAF